MAARPKVTVFSTDGNSAGNADLPAVFTAPIRHDIVRFVHSNISKNSRQAYAVSRRTGHRATAESWGTGRAVARIPRVSGGGTHRSGEGAYGNQCRGGRMFAPTRVYRRWNRRVNKNMRRYAVSSAVAASALPPLVMARGHKIEKVAELPLVVSDNIQSLNKTKEAADTLKALNIYNDVEKVKDTSKIRQGVGKSRNRRYVNRKGPLVVLSKNDGGWKAFRNLPGVDLAYASALNLLQLAPGGHLGRLIVWSEAAFRDLNALFGDGNSPATARNYRLPRSICSNVDVTGIINRDEVQAVLRPKRRNEKKAGLKHNPLRRRGHESKLCPYAKEQRRRVRSQVLKGKKAGPEKKVKKVVGKK
eukprot:NODE_666_length_1279_cov_124.888021_g627_i0.p2 GENE.NODE_666_length_1279_cov_124.888021_g627_i0~~NODE_666_length_1279_cov_124.888021_g627_i0.p2  ORF type:complete len:360 (+),score=121.24 NODE_666_length_1279_cov_124.888021_g627_i0:85-1164(+)